MNQFWPRLKPTLMRGRRAWGPSSLVLIGTFIYILLLKCPNLTFMTDRTWYNAWFDNDTPFYFTLHRDGPDSRIPWLRHLLNFPAMTLVISFFSLFSSASHAFDLAYSAVGAFSASLLFSTIHRRWGIKDAIAILFLYIGSTSFIFWSQVFESHWLSASAAVWILHEALNPSPRSPAWRATALVVAGAAFNPAHLIPAVAVSLRNYGWKSTLRGMFFALVFLAAILAASGYVRGSIPLQKNFEFMKNYYAWQNFPGLWNYFKVFWHHSFVSPLPRLDGTSPVGYGIPPLSFQRADLAFGSPVGYFASALWGAFLAIGLFRAGRIPKSDRLLFLITVWYFLFYLGWKQETFLHSPDFVPATLLTVALPIFTLTERRALMLSRALTWALVSFLFINNVSALDSGRTFLTRLEARRTEDLKARPTISTRPLAQNLIEPTSFLVSPCDPATLYVSQKKGEFVSVDLRTHVNHTLFRLDVRSDIEMGFLNFLPSPHFCSTGIMYAVYNPPGELRVRVSMLTLDLAIPSTGLRSEAVFFEYPVLSNMHMGGFLALDQAGNLLLSTGDGGPAGILTQTFPQDLDDARGKILFLSDSDRQSLELGRRLEPLHPKLGRFQVFAIGLRNPWRGVLTEEGELVMGDVGHLLWDEVNLIQKGDNLGWPYLEGITCHKSDSVTCRPGQTVPPLYSFPHQGKTPSAIIGGPRYRGSALPEFKDHIIFADGPRGELWGLERLGKNRFQTIPVWVSRVPGYLSCIGESSSHELVVCDFQHGTLLELVANPSEGS